MITAQKKDKPLVVDLLVQCFCDSKSIHYIIEKDAGGQKHLNILMSYAFDHCMNFGEIFLSEDRQACALILYPEKKILSIESLWQRLSLVVKSSGAKYFKKIAARQKVIRQIHPYDLKFHLWFMGVKPDVQRKGIGSRLLKELIAESKQQKRMFCLETPDSRHIPWLHKHGFGIYRQLDLGHLLYCLFHKDVLWKAHPFDQTWKPGHEKNDNSLKGGLRLV
ncbi:GNAT family N-acetyltransferase [Niabella yanshanensis]|uniref:GNAT family N-acetyltransferase n=1 Tax=Niabella yanshanensis TaxID=577386 RepID=A0ABZ0W404_9BACT|nr:GNAT family N-acetyltransferase [Niabella yanshanensis]WQD37274.1 GNAT family N-acetyltransferase [Niabella yanshanensis]